jgi:hypothetical protein
MPIDQDHPDPKIRIIFQGFVITRIKKGNATAEVGALKSPNCHSPKITVLKKNARGSLRVVENLVFDITRDFELKVEKANLAGIDTYTKGGEQFDRNNEANDPNDFRWFINLDTDLHKADEFTIIPNKLSPVFRLNEAIFYTESLTFGPLKIKRKNTAPQPFGKAAETISAIINLDNESKATLRNGINDVLVIDGAENGTSYTIIFNCECHESVQESDFPLIYEVIQLKDDADKKKEIDFVGEPLSLVPGSRPEVPCFGGNFGAN